MTENYWEQEQRQEEKHLKILESAGIERKNEPISESRPTSKNYKTIKLYLAEDKQDLLRQVCKDIGEDYSRVEDGQSSIIWDIIVWVAPALRIRRYLMELVGPVINCTPERERLKESK